MEPTSAADPPVEPHDNPVAQEPNQVPGIPLAYSLPILLAVGCVFYAVLNYVFPVFNIADELLTPFPPDGVAKVREIAFARCRLTNSLLAFATVAIVVAMLLPASLIITRRVQRHALRLLIPVAVGSALLSCLGVLLAHLVMEFTSSASLGITRTFLAHWLMFGFFGTGIGMAIGFAFGERQLTALACQQGLIGGLIAATLLDLLSVVVPRMRLDTLIPGGVLWGNRDSWLIALWVAFLLLPLAIALRNISSRPKKKKS